MEAFPEDNLRIITNVLYNDGKIRGKEEEKSFLW